MAKHQSQLLTIMLMSVMLLFAGCKDGKRSQSDDDRAESLEKLERVAKEVNRQCPISLGDMGQVTSIVFDDNTLTYNYDINETYADVEALSQNEEQMKRSMLTMISGGNSDMTKLVNMVIDADAEMSFVMKGNRSGATARATLSAAELEEALSYEATPEEVLLSAIESTNLQMPMLADEGLLLTEVKLDGDYVTYVCETDERLYDIDQMTDSRVQIKASMFSMISEMGPVEKTFMQKIVAAGKSLRYLYVGTTTGKQLAIDISTNEVRSQLNN